MPGIPIPRPGSGIKAPFSDIFPFKLILALRVKLTSCELELLPPKIPLNKFLITPPSPLLSPPVIALKTDSGNPNLFLYPGRFGSSVP